MLAAFIAGTLFIIAMTYLSKFRKVVLAMAGIAAIVTALWLSWFEFGEPYYHSNKVTVNSSPESNDWGRNDRVVSTPSGPDPFADLLPKK